MAGLAALAIGFLYALWWLVWPMQVDGVSMEPALEDGQLIWTSAAAQAMEGAVPGDLVILKHPATGRKLVKRLAAAAGDHVSIRDGRLAINGKPVPGEGFGPDGDWFVPRGQVFVLGDNPEASEDSRSFGCIDNKLIVRKVLK